MRTRLRLNRNLRYRLTDSEQVLKGYLTGESDSAETIPAPGIDTDTRYLKVDTFDTFDTYTQYLTQYLYSIPEHCRYKNRLNFPNLSKLTVVRT